MSSYDSLIDFPTEVTKHSRPSHLILAIVAGTILAGGLIGGTYYLTRSPGTDNGHGAERSVSPSETEESASTSPVPSRKPVLPTSDPTPDDAETINDTAHDVKSNPTTSRIPNDAVLILDRRIHIAPKSYFAQEFKVAIDARLRGTFDSTSPVEISVMTPQGSELYHSARINKGSIDVKLPPGDYYIIIENRFSWVTSKDVRAVIYIQDF